MKITKVLGKDINRLKSLRRKTKVLLTLEVGKDTVRLDRNWDGQFSIGTSMGGFRQDEIESVTLVEKDDSIPQLIIKLEEVEVLHTTYE